MDKIMDKIILLCKHWYQRVCGVIHTKKGKNKGKKSPFFIKKYKEQEKILIIYVNARAREGKNGVTQNDINITHKTYKFL